MYSSTSLALEVGASFGSFFFKVLDLVLLCDEVLGFVLVADCLLDVTILIFLLPLSDLNVLMWIASVFFAFFLRGMTNSSLRFFQEE